MNSGSRNPKLPNQTDTNSDDEPWIPDEDFGELFIHMDENNNCVISGPPEKVAEIKKHIANIITEEIPTSIDPEKLQNVDNIEFQKDC